MLHGTRVFFVSLPSLCQELSIQVLSALSSDKLKQENISVLSEGWPSHGVYHLDTFNPLLIYEWVDLMGWKVRHGWTSFVAMRPRRLLREYMNAPTGRPYWHCEGAISFSVKMSKTSSVTSYKNAITENYMSWSDYKRCTKALKMLINTSTRITQATKWACWDTGYTY